MKNSLKFFIVLIVSFAAAACSGPIGTLGGGGSGTADFLEARAKRHSYDINNTFKRGSDLSVIVSYQGKLESVSIDQVDIFIVEDPSDPAVPIPKDSEYLLTSDGEKKIIVNYRDMSDYYFINVTDPYNIGDNDNGGNGDDDDPGIVIIWP